MRQFDRVAAVAVEMRRALESRDWSRTARLLNLDWEAHKKSHPGITTPRIERLVAVARKQGALAAKACGAGGGGCVLFFVDPENRQRVESALAQKGARLLPSQISTTGLEVHRTPSRPTAEFKVKVRRDRER